MKKNQQIFNEEIKLKYQDLYEVLGEYLGRHVKVTIKCKICSRERETKPSILLSKKGIVCDCKKSLRYDIQDAIYEIENALSAMGSLEKPQKSLKKKYVYYTKMNMKY